MPKSRITTPYEPNRALIAAREKAGFATATDAARAFGWNVVTYRAHEAGRRALQKDIAVQYARSLRNVTANELMGLSKAAEPTESVPIVGAVAWGIWREMAIVTALQAARTHAYLPLTQKLESRRRLAYRVDDESCNRYVDPGEYVIYIEISPAEVAELTIGTLVIVTRQRDDLEEVTVRCITGRQGEHFLLTAHSDDKKYVGALRISHTNHSQMAAITGKVVARYGEM